MTDARIPLRVALPPYEHIREIVTGTIELAGTAPMFVDAGAPEADVCELPLTDHVLAHVAGDPALTAVPVFLSRAFVHRWLYAAAPALQSTVSVYTRGIATEFGIEREPEDPIAAERDHYVSTGVFPVLTVLAVRTELLDAHRWLATNVYRAFEVSRRRFVARAADIRASRLPIPGVAAHVQDLRELFGLDLCPYGVEPNRPALEAFIRYATEQSLLAPGAVADVAELFHPTVPFVDFTDGI